MTTPREASIRVRTDPWFLLLYVDAVDRHRVSEFPISRCDAMSFACASSTAYFHLLELRYAE